MRRGLFVALALFAAGCSGSEPQVAPEEPIALALRDPEPATTVPKLAETPVAETNVMRFVVGGEFFELKAGICNTYDDGTFRFALAEGTMADEGPVTATIERFDTGSGFNILLALEGLRADTTSVTWYAKDPTQFHQIDETVVGPEIRGTAIFTEVEDAPPNVAAAAGEFSLRCEASS